MNFDSAPVARRFLPTETPARLSSPWFSHAGACAQVYLPYTASKRESAQSSSIQHAQLRPRVDCILYCLIVVYQLAHPTGAQATSAIRLRYTNSYTIKTSTLLDILISEMKNLHSPVQGKELPILGNYTS